jgi:hypothetical protein
VYKYVKRGVFMEGAIMIVIEARIWRVVHEFNGGEDFASRQRATIFMAFRGKLMTELVSLSQEWLGWVSD